MKNFFREILSGSSGHLSSKRVFGAVSYLVTLGCIVFLVVTEGGSMVVEDLLQTMIIMSASLLGLESVTNIWKGKRNTPQLPQGTPKEEEGI